MTEKTFTPAEANRTLPLVKSIVSDLLDRARELRGLASLAQDPESDPEIRERQSEIRAMIAEIAALGCQFKDPALEIGLVDFPAEIDGEPVLLCWRGDEESITHYHGAEEGFAGRKRIPQDLL